jgi:outer membrane protein assembly factor BamD
LPTPSSVHADGALPYREEIVIPSRGYAPRALTLAVVATLVVGVLSLVGCGGHNPYPPGSYERGAFYWERNDYQKAAEALEVFVRQNPTDSLAAEAQYLKALSYMELREYPLAAVELQILRKDYPISPRVEDALFNEGVAYYRQVGRVERDITSAQEARLHFLDFARSYPGSPHMSEVRDYMLEISDMMVRKRMGAVEVYLKLHRYEAASITLDDIIADEPNSSLLDEALAERAELALRAKDEVVARRMWERLLLEFPDSPRAKRARSGLAKLTESGDAVAVDDEES